MDGKVTSTSLPPLYRPWLEEILDGPLPQERNATCTTCAMCAPHAAMAATASTTLFDPSTKCCTYVPGLPNFLVGHVLEDDSSDAAEGRASVRQRIARGDGVTPLGLQTPIQDAVVYKYTSASLFGRHRGLRCPHYLDDGGRCGIWRHRNSICATWFCKHEQGATGQAVWRALGDLLGTVERQLALWCATELGQGVEGLGPSLLPYYSLLTSAEATPPALRSWSNDWRDRPEDFYLASGRLVTPLTWTRVRAICGPTLGLEIKAVARAFRTLSTEQIPDRLRYNAVTVMPSGDGRVGVAGYTEHDMPRLPEEVARHLGQFDGVRSTEETTRAISQSAAVPLDRGDIKRLIDYRVLVPLRHAPPMTGTTDKSAGGSPMGTNVHSTTLESTGRPGIRPPSLWFCGILIAVAKVALRTVTLRRLIGWIHARTGPSVTEEVAPSDVAHIERAVATAAALYPGRALCLEQSIVLYYCLRRRGVDAAFRIGIQSYPFAAHAWVEYQRRPVNDVEEHVKWFAPFPHLPL